MIKLQDINKIYRCGALEVFALQGLNLEIKRGEFIAIIGPSGSGKSTLLHIIGCLDRQTSGEYYFEEKKVENLADEDLAEIRSRKIGFVFQFFNLFPHLTVLRNLELPMVFAGIGSKNYRMRMATKMLYKIGLPEKARFTPTEISGGEQQKVAIARALVNNPSILLADEPTGNLDSKSGERIMSIIQDLNRRGATIILSTHDEHIARQAKRVITLFDGKKINDEILG